MARTASNMLPLGQEAPNFSLLNTASGQIETLTSLKGSKGTLVMFICNHCPFVIHLHEGFQNLVKDYENSGISIIAINSNDVQNYPADSPENMTTLFQNLNLTIPYLYDETQEVAKAYDAACTPDFYLFDSDLRCFYRGQFDDSRPDNGIPVTGNDLRSSLDLLLNGNTAPEIQKPSLGCNIKWK